MRITSAALTAAIAGGAIAALAGCSGSSTSGAPSALPGTGNTTVAQSMVRANRENATGVAPKFLRLIRTGFPVPTRMSPDRVRPLLGVSDFGTGAVEVLNAKYHLARTITNGLNGPDGDWYDAAGNLYVTNYAGVTVQQYTKTGSAPTFTYNASLGDPVGVTVDSHGNVFVADYGFGGASVVVEYPQKSNTPSNVCSTGLAGEGVAVDSSGNVFVSGNNPNTGSANILEYSGGLSGCNATTLGVTLGFAGGMVITHNGTLAAIDQFAGVDIIPPPYNSISSTIGGFSDPFHNALNKLQNQIFVADVGNANVQILSYPAGHPIKTLGSGNGLSDPAGVARYPH
jgi:hypothetical protein